MSNLLPPLDCSLNVAQILDFHITHENHSVAYSFTDEVGNTTEISHFELSRAAHRVAHLLRPQRCGLEGQVLAIVAQTDVLIYQTIVVGCIIAGLVPFPISHRNTTAAIFHLLKNTGSHCVLTTMGSRRLVETVATDNAGYDLLMKDIPLLGQIYPYLGHETIEHPFVPYPSPTTSISSDDVTLYLHSSGSTGLPKPIPQTHRNLIHQGAMVAIAELVELTPRLAVGHLPAFHTMGLIGHILFPIFNGGTACLYPLSSTPTESITPVVSTAENALENARRTNATGVLTVPAFILEWQSPADVAYLKTLNVVAYAGGPLASRVGDSLFSQGVNILPIYGATELGIPTLVKRRQAEVDAGEWAWFRFNNRVNIRWDPQGDGTFECQFLTVPETHQVSVENLPDIKGYSTKDLFERHPTKPDLYKIVGRLDDVLIMANGEKTVPGPMEDVMGASPFIAGAVMFGRERNQVGVLIEPNHKYELDPTDEQQLVKYRNLIWPVVAEANENAPAFAQIYKEMILVTQPAKPMIRTPKGTVIKKPTIALYKQEIEDLYETIEASGNAASDIDPPLSWSSKDLEPWLIAHASLVAGKDIRGGRDLFDQGFDSLKATFLRHRIVGALRNSSAQATSAAREIAQNFVYAHPTIEDLANALAAAVRGDTNISLNNAKVAVENMIAKYSEGFEAPLRVNHKRRAPSTTQVVLLTGSTGGLGSHILEILLSRPAIERVYAFNRPGKIPVSERQREAFVDRGLDTTLLTLKKLVYLEGDSAKENLGLPFGVWTELRDTTTVIIHNAWTLDFNKTLSSFEPHVKGTRNLIDLARQSSTASGVRFLFTSSISSAQNWDQKRGPFPEELQLDASVAIGNGYGESKYVSERILAASGLEATSFRIGQISGSAGNGAWSTTDWVPAIVKSSIALGNFPSDPSGTVAWITPEAVSHAIIDAALSPETPPFAINLVHPRPVAWDFVMSNLASTVHLPLIPFGEWVQQLKDLSTTATAKDIEKIPGIKLLDFFKAAAAGTANIRFSTSKAQMVSESMRLLEPLRAQDAKQWMQYWKEFLA
ncbi:Acetyl-CoA synthetase-like protein [Mycena sanguinolenta]|uniref:Acetyl-CoA synthetase-like protein n=1 Tax=Mycena sanguinolenta TaxID=230812 RepID=A0A8H7CMS1_9AGAR|nr:Acetyl-CoA synthetase-like protein [Mycena sanguinolenta]